MRVRFQTIRLAIASALAGALAAQTLHAQGKPPAYVVVAIQSVKDFDGLKEIVARSSPQAIAAGGGHYVIRSNDIQNLQGTPPKRFVLIGFDSVEQAKAWEASPATREVTALRAKATDSVSFIVEGAPS